MRLPGPKGAHNQKKNTEFAYGFTTHSPDQWVEEADNVVHVAQGLGEHAGLLLLDKVGRSLEPTDPKQPRREAVEQGLREPVRVGLRDVVQVNGPVELEQLPVV